MKPIPFLLAAALAGLFSSCASPKICSREIKKSEPPAVALVAASRQAHGGGAFGKVRDLSVSYEGKWGVIGPRFQPVLVDRKFRGNSEERLSLPARIMAQKHTGPGGEKWVLRQPGRVSVSWNGVRSTDPEANRAAALVADAYTLFLLGPLYFDRPGVVMVRNGESTVDGMVCDEVLAVLRPGFGEAAEDRVVLFIDRAGKELRRVRMTLNGLESTRGAEVDVTFREFRRIGGMLWPTDFDERICVPFDLHAHHWKLAGLEINRGFRAEDLKADKWDSSAGAATAPVEAAPAVMK